MDVIVCLRTPVHGENNKDVFGSLCALPHLDGASNENMSAWKNRFSSLMVAWLGLLAQVLRETGLTSKHTAGLLS
jgi:hypothetical protein